MTRPTRGTTSRSARPSRRARSASKRSKPRNLGKIKSPPPEWFVIRPWLQEAGVYVNAETASTVAAVYGCCRLIVDCLAPAPIVITEVRAGGVKETLHDDPNGWVLNYGAPVDRAPGAPTSQAIEEALYWSALLGDGNGYAEIQRDAAGKFFALWPIESDRVIPRQFGSDFYYEVHQYSGGIARLESTDVFHLRGPSLRGFVGDSVVFRAARAIGIAHAAQTYSASYFANGTVVSGLLTSDKVITPAQADAAKARWKEAHGGGPSKAHDIAVMGGGVKYESLNHDAQESQLIESRRFQVQEIARFFGVPTTLLADNEAWTNLGELYLGFYRNALRPWAERFDAEATRKLFPQRQPWREVSHDLTHLTLGSFKDQVAALTQATGNKPIWTQNEARAIFGKNSVPGGDKLETEPKPAPQPRPALPAPKPDDDEPEEKPARPTLSARDAIVAMFADAFGRHNKRVKNRRADVKRDLVEADHANLRARLTEDCVSALSLAKRGLDGADWDVNLGTYAASLDAGEPPDKAAERVVSDLWRMAP